MDIDDDEQDSGNDELDVIDDDESMHEGEEEMEEDDDEEYEEEAETVPPPRVVPTARKISNQNRGPPAPVLATPPPPVSAQPKSGLRIRLNISKPSPLGAGAAQASGNAGKRPAREAAKKAGKRTKVVAMEAELGEWLRPVPRLERELMVQARIRTPHPRRKINWRKRTSWTRMSPKPTRRRISIWTMAPPAEPGQMEHHHAQPRRAK